MRDNLRIGTGAKSVAAILKLRPQLLKVIDLAVEHYPNLAIFVEDWLMPSLQIDDASLRPRPSDPCYPR
jgi:hypothetical protein